METSIPIEREGPSCEPISQERIKELKIFIDDLLTPETTNGTWCPFCPVYKQSRTISALVHDHFQGDILCSQTGKGTTHYWNRLPNGQEIDITRDELELLKGINMEEINVVDPDWFIFPGSKIEKKYEILKRESERRLKERGMFTLWELVLD